MGRAFQVKQNIMAISYIQDPEITKAIETASQHDWSKVNDGSDGRTTNLDGSKTGGGGKFWNGIQNFASTIRGLFGDNVINNTYYQQQKMSAGAWIAIGGVVLVVVVVVVVLSTRNK